MDDDGVSPVIAVILMVAITVVLGAVVWVLVSSFSGQDTGEAATMVGQRDETNDEWKIIVGSGVAQERITFAADKAGLRYAWNTTATNASPLLTVTPIQMQGAEAWGAGAYLSVCAVGSALSDVTVTFVDTQNNAVAAATNFAEVSTCA